MNNVIILAKIMNIISKPYNTNQTTGETKPRCELTVQLIDEYGEQGDVIQASAWNKEATYLLNNINQMMNARVIMHGKLRGFTKQDEKGNTFYNMYLNVQHVEPLDFNRQSKFSGYQRGQSQVNGSYQTSAGMNQNNYPAPGNQGYQNQGYQNQGYQNQGNQTGFNSMNPQVNRQGTQGYQNQGNQTTNPGLQTNPTPTMQAQQPNQMGASQAASPSGSNQKQVDDDLTYPPKNAPQSQGTTSGNFSTNNPGPQTGGWGTEIDELPQNVFDD